MDLSIGSASLCFRGIYFHEWYRNLVSFLQKFSLCESVCQELRSRNKVMFVKNPHDFNIYSLEMCLFGIKVGMVDCFVVVVMQGQLDSILKNVHCPPRFINKILYLYMCTGRPCRFSRDRIICTNPYDYIWCMEIDVLQNLFQIMNQKLLR